MEQRGCLSSQGILKHQTIQLDSAHAVKRGAPKLRHIDYVDKATGKQFIFITHHFDLAAATMVAIDKDRWQVALLFKAIKQHLNISAFVGMSKNAILPQVWIAMITYLLLAYARHSAPTGWTVQRIMRVVQMHLFERKSLKAIFQPDPGRRKKNEPQMRLIV